jgi:hypothetical protein
MNTKINGEKEKNKNRRLEKNEIEPENNCE